MVTENVNIRFRESGARVVKRRIDQIGQSANSATRGIFLMQRALFVIGGAGAISGLTRMADALTNVENRLTLTTSSLQELESVQKSLFDISRKSRSDFQATSDVYNRIALSAKTLGVAQREILNVTETLQKASIISGASAREANAALVQLGQGIASDRLSGDELRSVLEQLPAVADILVDYLNTTQEFGTVTRGTLRALGKEGKLTADIVFKAIQSSKSKIDELFSGTNATVDQSLQVAKTNFLELLDAFDDATGASNKLAQAIISLSENFDKIAATLITVGSLMAIAFTANVVTSFIARLKILGGSFARLVRMQASFTAAQAASTAATAADTRGKVANMNAIVARSGAQVASARLEYASAQAMWANGRARDAQTGRFVASQVARDRLTAATIRLSNAERVNLRLTESLTVARVASTTADNLAATAAARNAAAQAAQGGVLARLSRAMPILAGGVRLVARAFVGLTAAMAANPIGFILVVAASLLSVVFILGDRIRLFKDNTITLRDVGVAAFQLLSEEFGKFTEKFQPAIEYIETFTGDLETAFDKLVEASKNAVFAMIDTFSFIPRVGIGFVEGLGAVFNSIPDLVGEAIDTLVGKFIDGWKAIVDSAVGAVNSILDAFRPLSNTKIGKLIGIDGIFPKNIDENFSDVLDQYRTSLGAGGVDSSAAFIEGFERGFDKFKARNILDRVTEKVLERARTNRNTLDEDTVFSQQVVVPGERVTATPPDDGSGSSSQNVIERLQEQIVLNRAYGLGQEILNNVLDRQRELNRELTKSELENIAAMTRAIEVGKIKVAILEEINTPLETLELTQEALNQLFDEGAISLDQYADKLREVQVAALKASGTFSGGFAAAIGEAMMSASEFGQAMGQTVVDSVGKAADAIVEFAETGKLNIKSLFADLLKQILRLSTQRLLMGLLGNFFGFPTGFSQGGSILPGFSTGGSILPTGPGSTDSQLVMFNKRPDERVDILTPGQQANQRNSSNGETVVVNQTINVSTGVQQTVRAEIKGMMPEIAESAKVAVVEGKLRGGSYGGSFK